MRKAMFMGALLGLFTAGHAEAGCLAGAAVGGMAGHMAGHHGLLGAAAGCAIGHHHAATKARQANQDKQNTPDSGTH